MKQIRTVTFEVPGKPKSAQQLRFNRKTGGTYRTKQYKERVNEIAIKASDWLLSKDIAGPIFKADTILALEITFCFPFTSEHYRYENGEQILKDNAPYWYPKKIDIDNMLKSTKDAMSGIIYVDDGQIVEYASMKKIYDEKPRMDIFVERIN